MSLREKQSKFAFMLGNLLRYAQANGYEVTLGDAYRDPRATFPYSHPRSLHAKRLAIDLNVFIGGRLLSTFDEHLPLGEYWESIGGTWGGRFKPRPDCPHFSLEHEGMK